MEIFVIDLITEQEYFSKVFFKLLQATNNNESSLDNILFFDDFSLESLAPHEKSTLETVVSIVVPITFGIVFIVGLIGNSFVIWTASKRHMRSPTNILIVSLAIADLLFIIFCVPNTAVDYVTNKWLFGEAWCKLVQYVIVVTVYVSVYTLALLSLDRFIVVICNETLTTFRTNRNALVVAIFLWILTLLSCLPVISVHGTVEYK